MKARKKNVINNSPGQQRGAIARNVAGSGAQRKQCGSIISNANVDGHSIFSQCKPSFRQMHNFSHPSLNCSPICIVGMIERRIN